MARNYSSVVPAMTLASTITSTATQLTLAGADSSLLPTPPYTLVLNPDTAIEEIITVNANQSGVTFPTLNVTRAEEGTTGQPHTNGNTVKHMITGRDLQDAQDHIAATESVHGISDTANLVYLNTAQTLTNKRLTSPKINEDVAEIGRAHV